MKVHPRFKVVLEAQQKRQEQECRRINNRLKSERSRANESHTTKQEFAQPQVSIRAGSANRPEENICKSAQAH